jgi:hypothetical protein
MDDPGTRIEPIDVAGDELRADALMPSQFYPARRGSASVEPIVRLMGGILADAVRCFQRNFDAHQRDRKQEFREARFWIFHDKGEGPFSFVEVCDALGIDPRRLRNLILHWEENRRPGDQPRMIRRSAVNTGSRVQARRRKG